MFLKKKWFALLCTMIAIAVLTACGDSEKEVGTAQDAEAEVEQDASAHDFMPLSDALEEYSLWFRVEGDPYELTRDSSVYEMFVFEDGNVKQYNANSLDMEELVEMSDDEIIETVIDNLHENENYDEDDENPESVEYTLDITLDKVGKDTHFINLETEPETLFSVIDETGYQTIFDTHFSGLVYNQEDRSDEDDFIITRVEDESILFTLDDADTKKENITIEKAEELEELREAQEDKDRIASEEAMPHEEHYQISCASCHGEDLSGAGGPGLENIGGKLSYDEINDIIVNGKGAMPGGMIEDDGTASEIAEWLSEMN